MENALLLNRHLFFYVYHCPHEMVFRMLMCFKISFVIVTLNIYDELMLMLRR